MTIRQRTYPNHDRFHDAKGNLTPYALLCGYQQKRTYVGPGEDRHSYNWHQLPSQHAHKSVDVTLWQECPGLRCYHVRASLYPDSKRLYWLTFDKLTDARRCLATPPYLVYQALKRGKLQNTGSNPYFKID